MTRVNDSEMMQLRMNGCLVTISFAEQPVKGVLNNIKSILSSAYAERVRKGFMGMSEGEDNSGPVNGVK